MEAIFKMAKIYEDAIAALKENPQKYTDDIAGHITRIEDSKVVIINKLIEEWGLADEANWQLDDAAIAIDSIITNNPELIKQDAQGQHYVDVDEALITLPDGYYKDVVLKLGDVSEEYRLQTKSVTPDKKTITVSPDAGMYGLSSVTINPIPAKYQDVTPVTAAATDVLPGKKFVDNTGAIVEGTMATMDSAAKVLDVNNPSQYIPGSTYVKTPSTISIVLEEKEVYPEANDVVVTPSNGKVLSEVRVASVTAGVDYVVNEGFESTGTIDLEGTAKTGGNVIEGAEDTITVVLGTSEPSYAGGKFNVGVTAKVDGINVASTQHALDMSVHNLPALTAELNDDGSQYVITANSSVTKGYMSSDSNKSQTYSLDVLDDSNIEISLGNTAGTVRAVVDAGYFHEDETKQINLSSLDSDFTAANIKAGVNMFGVPGTFTSDGTAAAGNIEKGKIAYVNGAKIVGTFEGEQVTATASATGTVITPTAGKYIDEVIVPQSTITIAEPSYAGGTFTVHAGLKQDGGNTEITQRLDLGMSTASISTMEGAMNADSTKYVVTANGSSSKGYTTGQTFNKSYELDVNDPSALTLRNDFSNNSQVSVSVPEGYYKGGSTSININQLTTGANLTAGNLKHGVSLFGVTGTFTSDADAIAANLEKGKVAYVKGQKVTGTFTGVSCNPSLSTSEQNLTPSAGQYFNAVKIPAVQLHIDGDSYSGGLANLQYEDGKYYAKAYVGSGYDSATIKTRCQVQVKDATTATATTHANELHNHVDVIYARLAAI